MKHTRLIALALALLLAAPVAFAAPTASDRKFTVTLSDIAVSEGGHDTALTDMVISASAAFDTDERVISAGGSISLPDDEAPLAMRFTLDQQQLLCDLLGSQAVLPTTGFDRMVNQAFPEFYGMLPLPQSLDVNEMLAQIKLATAPVTAPDFSDQDAFIALCFDAAKSGLTIAAERVTVKYGGKALRGVREQVTMDGETAKQLAATLSTRWPNRFEWQDAASETLESELLKMENGRYYEPWEIPEAEDAPEDPKLELPEYKTLTLTREVADGRTLYQRQEGTLLLLERELNYVCERRATGAQDETQYLALTEGEVLLTSTTSEITMTALSETKAAMHMEMTMLMSMSLGAEPPSALSFRRLNEGDEPVNDSDLLSISLVADADVDVLEKQIALDVTGDMEIAYPSMPANKVEFDAVGNLARPDQLGKTDTDLTLNLSIVAQGMRVSMGAEYLGEHERTADTERESGELTLSMSARAFMQTLFGSELMTHIDIESAPATGDDFPAPGDGALVFADSTDDEIEDFWDGLYDSFEDAGRRFDDWMNHQTRTSPGSPSSM